MRVAASHSILATPNPLWLAAALVPGLAIVVCLVFYPIGLAIWASLGSSDGGLTLQRYAAFFSEGESYRALVRTVGLALATTTASIVLSIPLGYVGRIPGWIGTLVRVLVALPLAVPVLIAGYALALFYADNGLFNNLLVRVLHVLSDPLSISYTWTGLVIACVWRFFPYTGLLVISALQSIDRNIEQAAASTGANPWQVFWRVDRRHPDLREHVRHLLDPAHYGARRQRPLGDGLSQGVRRLRLAGRLHHSDRHGGDPDRRAGRASAHRDALGTTGLRGRPCCISRL